MVCETIAVRLRVDRDVLRDAYRRRERDHAPRRHPSWSTSTSAPQLGKIGTLSYSDPETGSHFWYPVSSRRALQRRLQVRKKASWTTSAGFADFYVVQTTSPDFSGYDDLSVFVVDGDQVQSQPSLWDALGLRGNESGPARGPECRDPADAARRARGRRRELERRVRRPLVPDRLLLGVERARARAIDIAKRHTTRKKHVDVGLRVADYPTIQDYVGEALMDTNASRLFVLSVAQAMDRETDDNTRNPEPGALARGNYLHWAWQIKFEAAKNVAHVVDKMLHACGGRATSATWSSNATCATRRPVG